MRLTVKAGIVGLTWQKKRILDQEYDNLQRFLHGDKSAQVYSANKQQARRYYKKIKPSKEYPISLRKDLINLRKAKTFWFLKIPVKAVKGGIKVPLKAGRDLPHGELCESKITRRGGRYYAHLVFKVPEHTTRRCSSVLAVDLGERFAATAVLLHGGSIEKAQFLGKEIRGIRRHYAWLRKRLQERGLTQIVKRIGDKEKRAVSAILHRVSKRLVSLADSTDSYIVLGDLKEIRSRTKGKGKRFNRIVSNMPYDRLSQMIEYKAALKGIPVIRGGEAYTSKTCHICGCKGSRPSQGLFKCKRCGEYNADLNAAINIGKKFERFKSYMPLDGAAVNQPLTSSTLEASQLVGR